jgi:hypothetical protein
MHMYWPYCAITLPSQTGTEKDDEDIADIPVRPSIEQ